MSNVFNMFAVGGAMKGHPIDKALIYGEYGL